MWTLIFYTHSHFHTSIFYQLINVNAPQPDAYIAPTVVAVAEVVGFIRSSCQSALSIVGIRVVAVDAIGGRREVRGISEAAIVIKRASGISGWASFGEKPILGCALREDSLPAIVAVIVLLNESIGRVGL